MMETSNQFDAAALKIDLPEENLRRGRVGTIVDVCHESEAVAPDFVNPQGFTCALLTLPSKKTDASAIRTA